jgi:hypothetical protein
LTIARKTPSVRSNHPKKIFLVDRLIIQPIKLNRISITAKISVKLIKDRNSTEGREGLKRPVTQGCNKLPRKIPRTTPASEHISLINPSMMPLTIR